MDNVNMLAAEATTITLRLSYEELKRFMHDQCGLPESDDCPSLTGDPCESEHKLMAFCAEALGFKTDIPFWSADFFAETQVGPVVVLYEEGTGFVCVILRRPTEGIFRVMSWMIEDMRATLDSLAA